MWITDLPNDKAERIFGEFAREIRAYTNQLILVVSHPKKPISLETDEYEDSLRLYGPNGPSVSLFLKTWKGIEWRKREGNPHQRDGEVTRVHHYTEALGPTTSPIWEQALGDTGYQSADPILSAVWNTAAAVGFEVGGFHPSFLAGGSAAELAQMPNRDIHFFLDLMPWIRDGHWPCGWDDSRNRLKVL